MWSDIIVVSSVNFFKSNSAILKFRATSGYSCSTHWAIFEIHKFMKSN